MRKKPAVVILGNRCTERWWVNLGCERRMGRHPGGLDWLHWQKRDYDVQAIVFQHNPPLDVPIDPFRDPDEQKWLTELSVDRFIQNARRIRSTYWGPILAIDAESSATELLVKRGLCDAVTTQDELPDTIALLMANHEQALANLSLGTSFDESLLAIDAVQYRNPGMTRKEALELIAGIEYGPDKRLDRRLYCLYETGALLHQLAA